MTFTAAIVRPLGALLLLTAGLAPSAAFAIEGDAPVATADAGVSPPSGEAPPPLDEVGRFESLETVDPFGAPLQDRKPHGTVSVGAGTGGYREVAGAVVVPVGKTGEVAASIVMVDGAYGQGRRR